MGRPVNGLLQGEGTEPTAVAALEEAAAQGVERTVELLHYRKDGTSFCDQARSNFWMLVSLHGHHHDLFNASYLAHIAACSTHVVAWPDSCCVQMDCCIAGLKRG